MSDGRTEVLLELLKAKYGPRDPCVTMKCLACLQVFRKDHKHECKASSNPFIDTRSHLM